MIELRAAAYWITRRSLSPGGHPADPVAGDDSEVWRSTIDVIARSEATKQSILACYEMECFAEPVIGRAFARPVGSQ